METEKEQRKIENEKHEKECRPLDCARLEASSNVTFLFSLSSLLLPTSMITTSRRANDFASEIHVGR